MAKRSGKVCNYEKSLSFIEINELLFADQVIICQSRLGKEIVDVFFLSNFGAPLSFVVSFQLSSIDCDNIFPLQIPIMI